MPTWACYMKGDLKSAVAALEFAAEKLPGNPSVHYHLGAAYYKSGKPDKALAALETAFSLSDRFFGYARAENLIQEIKKRIAG